MTGRETRPPTICFDPFLRLPLRGSCRKATEGVFDTLLPPRCGPPSSKRKAKKHFHKPITKASFAFWQCPLTQLSKALHIIPDNRSFFCLLFFSKKSTVSTFFLSVTKQKQRWKVTSVFFLLSLYKPITEVSFAYFSFQRKVWSKKSTVRRRRAWFFLQKSLW